jgi:hypothetical protein
LFHTFVVLNHPLQQVALDCKEQQFTGYFILETMAAGCRCAGLEDDDTDTAAPATDDRGSAEAGVVRGLARSMQTIGRQAVKLPSVGRLPAPRSGVVRLPVKQVAKISDRISTGWSMWDSAQETGAWQASRLRQFAISECTPKIIPSTPHGSVLGYMVTADATVRRTTLLRTPYTLLTLCIYVHLLYYFAALVKNLVLGAAVFETYCCTVEHLAPPGQDGDEYARASVPAHVVSGALGGSVHGVVGTVWEAAAGERTLHHISLGKMTLHHSAAHATLFGSYEGLKRLFVATNSSSSDSQHQGPAYLGSVSVAGGMAGQLQYIMSHYTKQWLRLEADVGEATVVTSMRRPPVLRNILMAFPPSAIGFIAFEYGRKVDF